MNRKPRPLMPAVAFTVVIALLANADIAFGQPPGGRPPRPNLPPIPPKGDTTHTLTRNFIPASKTTTPVAPHENGFIQRWFVLEPIRKDIQRNNILTEQYIRTAFAENNFSTDFTFLPKNGRKTKVGKQQLQWHALDSKTFIFNLYNFTYAINKPPYGNIFWLVTVINCPEDIPNVRMAAGVNSGGMFWLNGEEVLVLSGDRDMVVDNVVSQPITLKKGKNIIRGAIINGPGMCTFAVRFLDENGAPVKNFTISYE
jgi:hypothetical protein